MKALERFDKQFFPVLGLIMLAPMMVAWYLFAQKDMMYPPLDLRVYRRAADFFAAGQSPYDIQFSTGDFTFLPWVYTPFGTLFVAPLHVVPESLLFAVWTTFAVVLPVVVLMAVSYQAYLRRADLTHGHKVAALVIFAFCGMMAGPVVDVVVLGQIGALLVAMTMFDLAAPDSWFRWGKFRLPRGVLTGIAGAIKLVPLIAVPYWIITRQWRAAGSALITLIGCWGLALLVMPGDSIRYVVEGHFLGTNSLSHTRTVDNQSFIALITRIVGDGSLPLMIWAPITLGLVAVGLLAARSVYRKGNMLAAGLIVGLTSVLASPVSWIHHIVWLAALPGLVLAGRSMRADDGKVSNAAIWWFGAVLLTVFPPLRYGWSPLYWAGVTEHYNVLAIVIIGVLWWDSRKQSLA